jgi:hypothetical protein
MVRMIVSLYSLDYFLFRTNGRFLSDRKELDGVLSASMNGSNHSQGKEVDCLPKEIDN